MNTIRIGIIREEKNPPDSRVPFTPVQCRELAQEHSKLEIFVQPSADRSYSDEEYRAEGVILQEDLSNCDVLMGVKEVPVDRLIPGKKYLFFSHTIKEQSYNRGLLQSILEKGIQLIDYETLTWENGARILGFGRYAGIVGAHNGLLVWGKRNNAFELKPAHECKDFKEIKSYYTDTNVPPLKIVVTGGGRVARGAIEVLDLLRIKKVDPVTYLENEFDHPVYVQMDVPELYLHKEHRVIDVPDFYKNPHNYDILFHPYTRNTDLMINATYWDPSAPIFFTKEEMRQDDFRIKVIADITCDIEGSIPATHKSTTIDDPVFGYDPFTEKEVDPYAETAIDIMSVDNLPNELPRDASEGFGKDLMEHIVPELLKDESDVIHRASITKDGELTDNYSYLNNYVNG